MRVEAWKDMVVSNLSPEEGRRYLHLWSRYSPYEKVDPLGLTKEELTEFRYLEQLSRGGVKK
jgi:hypothetical protein